MKDSTKYFTVAGICFIALAFVLTNVRISEVHAQTAPTALTFHAIADHTHCSLAQTTQTDGRGPGICIASDGVFVQSSADTAPWQLTKPGTVAITVNSKAPDATGNIALKISDLPGTLLASQDKPTRTCPITGMTVGSTGDQIKLGSCGD